MKAPLEERPVGEGLRERHVAQTESSQINPENNTAQVDEDVYKHAEKERKTFGRTPDGTVFTVPQTHDMVSQLLDPRQPKNLSDLVVLTIMAMHILLLYMLPQFLRRPIFAVIFLFWRACYNIGIGYLLRVQSHHRRLVIWAKKLNLFQDPSSGKNPRPWLYKLLKQELETKIPVDYKFEGAPIEYNTWLVFRRVVDLILMCDFTSYCLFAIACGVRPADEGFTMSVARWSTGILLFGFNLWVKLDAHRVVKDYAWYWGDFFYLIDQELTFDGVFEMAPHPMYSVGYAGYYGISMMAASYSVLFISIIAHAAQFAFLVYVENPHIEKTYNPPPPRKRHPSLTEGEITLADELVMRMEDFDQVERPEAQRVISSLASTDQPLSVHNLMGLKNIDPYRITDVSVFLLQGYLIILTAVTPSTPIFQALFVIHAVVWRLWYAVGTGVILTLQSSEKKWTRHFLKFGESTGEAWRQWKGLYHLSMMMCYASFIAACWKMYSFPLDWGYGMVLLKHIIGASLVALQIWTAVSIYDSLGEFGWFFGDFFFDHAPKLTYSGIYRYLNNPERFIGLAGVWGAVFITSSKAIFFLALFSHIFTLGFIELVEKPHMQKLYGRSLRKEAGLTKSIRRSLPPPLKQLQGSVDTVLRVRGQVVEEFLDAARSKFAAGVSTFVRDTSTLFQHYPARLTVTLLAPDLAGYNPEDYSLDIEGTPSSAVAANEKATDKEGQAARQPPERRSDFMTLMFEYGAPIIVKWKAPANHKKKDWVGLYMVADNASREVTRVSSGGRWVPTNLNEYDSTTAESGILVSEQPVLGGGSSESKISLVEGKMVFEGDKLWWTQGVFEFRYHHDGKHNVMSISLPFEIRIGRLDDDEVGIDSNGRYHSAVETALLPVVRNCFDRDPEIAPNSVDETFGALVERDKKYARRVVFAVHQMFGIEFAPGVVLADGTVRNLAWRICNAKQVLAPYSMSHSKGATTPTAVKD